MPRPYKLAILSDIHGNLTAFEAVLADLKKYSPIDGIIVAGDIIGGPGQEEILQRLREMNAVMIQGNWDHRIVTIDDGTAPGHFYTASQHLLIRWLHAHLSSEAMQFLHTLPEQRTFHPDGADPIRIVHGSPRHIAEKVYPQSEDQLNEVLSLVLEPVVIFGHTHVQWQVSRHGRLALNPGALFNSHNCPGAQYALLCWGGSAWSVFPMMVPYDKEKVREAFQATGFLSVGPLPKLFLYVMNTGNSVEQSFIKYAKEKAEEAGYNHWPYIPDEIWDSIKIEDFLSGS